jgi:hypothetical protein
MSLLNKVTIRFFIILIFCLLFSVVRYGAGQEPVPIESEKVKKEMVSEKPESDFSFNATAFVEHRFSRLPTWGNDVLIASGSISGGISSDYDTAGNFYAARCTTWSTAKGVLNKVIVYRSTNNGTSWSPFCGYGPFVPTFAYPVILSGSINNKLYLFVWINQNAGDIFMARFNTLYGSFETSAAVAPDEDTISYFTACTNMGRGDTLVVVYQKDRTGGTPYLYSTMSTDYGLHWSTPQNQSGDGEHPDIAYGQAGNVYLAYHKTVKDDIAFLRGKTYETGPWDYLEYLTSDSTSHHDDFPKIAALHTSPADSATVWVVYDHGGSTDKAEDLDLRFAYSTNSGVDWTKDQILTGSSLIGESESEGITNLKIQPCGTTLDTLWGGTSPSYYWRNPSRYGDRYFNERFDMPVDHGGRLDEIRIVFYMTGSTGTPDPDLYVWSSDGTYPLDNNPPAGAIAHFHVDYDSIVWYPSYTVIETWDSGIVLDAGEKFHIGFGHAYADGDTLSPLSDDGSLNSNRSVQWTLPGQWGTILNDWGIGVDFMINALICPITPPSYNEMAVDLEVYRSASFPYVDLCYLRSQTKSLVSFCDVYYTWAQAPTPDQFHTPHDKINDHPANWSLDGREVCQIIPTSEYPGIVYAGVPLLKGGGGNSVDGAWNLYFDYHNWTEVEEEVEEEELPVQFSLSINCPNPFNPATRIQYSVGAKSTQPVPIKLRIYNVLGQLVRTLVEESKKPGNYEVIWDGREENGNEVASGVYLYRLEAGEFTQTQKMVLIR